MQALNQNFLNLQILEAAMKVEQGAKDSGHDLFILSLSIHTLQIIRHGFWDRSSSYVFMTLFPLERGSDLLSDLRFFGMQLQRIAGYFLLCAPLP